MNSLYTVYHEKFIRLKELYEKYGFETSLNDIKKDIGDIQDFKVTVPLVGGFSTGKSSLINALIGYDLLSTDITPETAVPAEMSYGTDSVTYCMKNGETQSDSLNTTGEQIIPHDASLVQYSLNNDFFAQIPDIRLVDMPGFDSGIEIHNRAINDYLPKSLAYIIAIAADEGTVRASILNFLTELQLNEMPVYVVITKADKYPENEIEEMITHIRPLIEKKMNLHDVKIAVTSADDSNTEQIEELLLDLQAQSETIFQNVYNRKLKYYTENLCSYLKKQISAPDTTLIQVQEDKKLLEEKISEMQQQLKSEKDNFETYADQCIDRIRNKVESELRSSSSVLENILIQGGSIQEKINFLVRNAITAGIREQLEPKLQKHITNIAGLIQLDEIRSNSGAELLDKNTLEDQKAKREALQAAVTPVTTVIATLIGTLFSGPLAPVIGGALGSIIGAFLNSTINKKSQEQEEAQRREAASKRVNQVINEVLVTIKAQIEATVYEMIGNVNAEIDREVNIQIEMKKKELSDLEASLSDSEQQQQEKIAAYQADLAMIESITEEIA